LRNFVVVSNAINVQSDTMLRRKLGDANAPPRFFLPNNTFLTTELKRGKYNRNIFAKRLFGWCKDQKKRVLREAE
jgi:hypothetical protein